MTDNNVPAGWYPDQSGRMRWWDGSQWTDQFQDSPPPAPPPAAPTSQATSSATTSQMSTGPAVGNARADAKAAKAYAKATRPWYKKKRFIIPAALVAVIAISVAASGGGSSDGGASDKTASSGNGSKDSGSTEDKKSSNSGKKSDTKVGAFGSDKLPLQNGDWRLDSIKVTDDGFGGWTATGRVTYTGDDKAGGNNLFTVTLFKGKEVVGTLTGGGNTVKPGTTVTVQFLETGNSKYVKGPYKYDFQNDL